MIRRNNKSFITKNLRKTITKRSALKKRANISNNPEIIKLYKKQRNYVVNLSRKVKKKYFQKHMPHGSSLTIFGNFANHCFQMKQQILTIKFNDITKGLNIQKWCISDKLSDEYL